LSNLTICFIESASLIKFDFNSSADSNEQEEIPCFARLLLTDLYRGVVNGIVAVAEVQGHVVFLLLDVDACRAAQIDRGCQIQVDAAQATGSLAQAFGLRLRARSRLDLWQVPGEQGLYRSRKQKRTRVLVRVLVRDKGRARGRETRDREIGTKRKSPPIESQMEAEFLAAFHRAVKVSPFWIMSLCLSFSFSLSRMPIDDKPGQSVTSE